MPSRRRSWTSRSSSLRAGGGYRALQAPAPPTSCRFVSAVRLSAIFHRNNCAENHVQSAKSGRQQGPASREAASSASARRHEARAHQRHDAH